MVVNAVLAPRTPASPWHGAAGRLALAVRQALLGAAGRVALRLAPAGPHRRRAVRLLLQEAAQAGGGRVLESAAGELLLLGVTAAEAARAEAALSHCAGGPVPGTLWHLPQDAAPLLAWAEAAATPPAEAGVACDLASLDAALAMLPLGQVLVRREVLRLGPGRTPGFALRRMAVSRTRLAAALGPLSADPDLLDHAMDRIARRLAEAPPADRAGAAPPMLPLPLRGDPAEAPAPGATGVLPLVAAAGAALSLPRRERLAAAGWRLAIGGLDAAALHLIALGALPGEALLLLRWSPALADRAAQQALRGLDPERLVLTGCDGPEAFAWGFGRGIGCFAGPAVEALVNAARSDAARVAGAERGG